MPKSVCRHIAIALLLFVFSVNVYRARTQSITHDEALFQSMFLTGPLSRLFDTYHASHHILHTILCKISVSLFGLSEFTLRIPSLLGGLLYLVTLFRLSRRLFGEGLLFLLSVALLSLNPQLMDFMSVARGYGLALGLFLWALYQLLQYTGAGTGSEDGAPSQNLVLKAGIGLALSVASNLTFLFPAAVLALIFLCVLLADAELGASPSAAGRLSFATDAFAVPGIVTAFIIMILPLAKARAGDYFVGGQSLGESLENLIAASLEHHPLSGWRTAILPMTSFMDLIFRRVLVPAVFLTAVAACLVVLYRWARRGRFRGLGGADRSLLLCGGSLLLTVGLLVASHRMFRVLYPLGRTELYLVVLFVLTALILWTSIRRCRIPAFLTGLPLAAVAIMWLLHFAVEFQTTHYTEWRYDSATKRIVRLIRERHAREPRPNVRVGISGVLEPAMNFYRRLYKLDWLEPLDRKGPDGSFDYYVILDEDTPIVKKLGLSVVYTDAVSGASLAMPGGRPAGTANQ